MPRVRLRLRDLGALQGPAEGAPGVAGVPLRHRLEDLLPVVRVRHDEEPAAGPQHPRHLAADGVDVALGALAAADHVERRLRDHEVEALVGELERARVAVHELVVAVRPRRVALELRDDARAADVDVHDVLVPGPAQRLAEPRRAAPEVQDLDVLPGRLRLDEALEGVVARVPVEGLLVAHVALVPVARRAEGARRRLPVLRGLLARHRVRHDGLPDR